MTFLKVTDLHLSLDGKPILDGLSMDVERGAVHALVGPNGAGKSTLAYTLMGLAGYFPDSGSIVFDGRPITDLPVHERARIGLSLAWQEPARFEGLQVRDFLLAGAAEKDEDFLREALQKVALDPDRYLDRPPYGGFELFDSLRDNEIRRTANAPGDSQQGGDGPCGHGHPGLLRAHGGPGAGRASAVRRTGTSGIAACPARCVTARGG